ncbi:hypothetical protein LAJ55_15050, partial [Streptococcus pneumoniae]|uniref:hypothetical protein n=1 Tax=Streptococcus pneumoniae TaxID=1313 RepID=UPI001CBBD6B5
GTVIEGRDGRAFKGAKLKDFFLFVDYQYFGSGNGNIVDGFFVLTGDDGRGLKIGVFGDDIDIISRVFFVDSTWSEGNGKVLE